MLSQAKLAGIDFDFFNFIVYREGKGFKYGFMPRDYIPDEKMQSFNQFRLETQKASVVKNEEEEEHPQTKVNNTTAAAAAAEEEEEEESIEGIDLTNLD